MNAMMAIETMGKPGLALDIPKNQSFDQWVEMGRSLCEGQRVVNWWIGDWWIAGQKYGARAVAAGEGIFGKEFGSAMNCGTVSRAFPPSLRNEVLTWDHHRHAAPLAKDCPEEATTLLTNAAAAGLSTREFRVEVIRRRTALGLFKPRDDPGDDPGYFAVKGMAAAWNRGTREDREEFAAMVAASDLGVIEV